MKYIIDYTSNYKKQRKKMIKQGKNISKLDEVVEMLANDKKLDSKYKDHILFDNKYYRNCRECHIEPDWLLVYKIQDNELILLLFATGSHSELFNK